MESKILKQKGGSCCAIATCINNYSKSKNDGKSNISFHRFPKDLNYRKEWVQKCKRGDHFNPDTSFICSDHFNVDAFVRDLKAELLGYKSKSRRLKEDAIPTLNLPTDLVESASIISRRSRMERKSIKEDHNKIINSALSTSNTMAVCFICNTKLYGERTRVCSSVTPHSNSPYADKICELLGEEFVVIVTPADHMCKRCTSLLIHMDKLENDLKLVKNAMVSYVQKKYGLLPADQPVKSIEVVNGNIKTDDLEVGQRRVPSGLTVREPSTSAGASSNASSKTKQDSSKMKIYKCGFCSFQSKDLGHVRFHMRSHMKKNDKTNQAPIKTVTQQQPQQQQPQQQQNQNQSLQLVGMQNKQQQPQQPYKQPQQQPQKKRLYRCQVCSASFDTRVDCLEHIHKDHNQPQPVAEVKGTDVTLEEVAVFQPHDIPNSVENQQIPEKNNDERQLLDGKSAMNNTDTDLDMLFNDNVPNENSEVPAVQTQNISENTSDQGELAEIPGTNEDIGDMAIGGNETGTADHLDIESMLAAIHNDVSPPNDGGNPQNL